MNNNKKCIRSKKFNKLLIFYSSLSGFRNYLIKKVNFPAFLRAIPVPLATWTMMSQQLQQATNQRVIGASYGMLRSGSGGRVETTSLIGEKTSSTVSNNVAQSYGATVQIDDP